VVLETEPKALCTKQSISCAILPALLFMFCCICPDWPLTHDSLPLPPKQLGLQVCVTTSDYSFKDSCFTKFNLSNM
jgi:hypothetical protein